MPERRHYGQLCGLAVGLDVVGERWTMLILRDLMLGPARFNELLEGLPGIGPSLLTSRLRVLTEHGVIRQEVVNGDGRGRVYVLTEVGEAFRAPLLGLATWGLKVISDADVEDAVVKASWAQLAVEALMQGRRVAGKITENYLFEIDEAHFHVAVIDGNPALTPGTTDQWAMRMQTDASTFVKLGARLVSPVEAVQSQALTLDGSAEAIERCADLLGMRDAG